MLLPLVDKQFYVQLPLKHSSGLNWGHRNGDNTRDKREAYIYLRSEDTNFPPNPRPFILIWLNHLNDSVFSIMIANRSSKTKEGKEIKTPKNGYLGTVVRGILGLDDESIIESDHLPDTKNRIFFKKVEKIPQVNNPYIFIVSFSNLEEKSEINLDFKQESELRGYLKYLDFSCNESLIYLHDKKSLAPTQLLLQGPPGTGKSYTLKQDLKKLFNCTEQELETTQQIERIVGHPELTSADFIGNYRPVMNGDKLSYEFTPGPFTRLLKRALDSEAENAPHVLIIEELNRTNAAALFADVFQLLDRDENGRSEYSTNLGQDVNGYLEKSTDFKAYLPANLAIWATMNTADQGVFPLDTAFKRRWSFKYLGVNDGRNEWWGVNNGWNPKILGDEIYWQELRVFINKKLSEGGFDEDRQLGPFFLSKSELKADRLKESVMTKVIGYLRDDVLRYEPHVLFKKSENDRVKGFGALLREMEQNGILSVFKDLPHVDQATLIRSEIADFLKVWGALPLDDHPLNESDEEERLEEDNEPVIEGPLGDIP